MASIKRNYFFNLLLNVSAVIFPLITAPYVARVLDPDGLGLANFAGSYTTYFCLFALLGTGTYNVREIAKHREDHSKTQKFVSEIFSVTTINTAVCSLMFLFSVLLIPRLAEEKLIFILSGITLYLIPLQVEWYFIGMENVGIVAYRRLTIRILSIVALFIFVKSKNDLWIYIILGIISSLGGIIWNLWRMKKEDIHLKFTMKGIKKHYKPLLILFSSSIAISIYTILDSLMLGFMTNYSEVGYYSQATHIAKAILQIVTSLSAVAIPRVAYYFHNKDYVKINDLMSKSIGVVSFLAWPLMIGLICVAPRFVPLFLGEDFQGAVIPLMIMAGVIVAIGFNNITGMQVLLGIGKDKEFFNSVLVGTVSNFILNLIMIPKLGASGAALASVIAETLILGVTYYFVRKKTDVDFGSGIHDLWKSLIASLLFIPITFIIYKFLEGWMSVICTIIICCCIYPILQSMMKNKSYYMMYSMIRRLLTKREQ